MDRRLYHTILNLRIRAFGVFPPVRKHLENCFPQCEFVLTGCKNYWDLASQVLHSGSFIALFLPVSVEQ